VIKAFRVRSSADIQAAEAFHTDFHLLDARSDSVLGGTGQTFDWELVKGRRTEAPLILAGGLTPANVAEGIQAVHPYAVDVASGVEAEPGIKDPDLVHAFIVAAQPTPAGDRA
jgi:phosphoribosylanthranilate isomerase